MWYMSNESLHRDLKISTIEEKIRKVIGKHRLRLQNHPNNLVTTLIITINLWYSRRLKRKIPQDLIM